MILMANDERCYVGYFITSMAIYPYLLAFKDITHGHVNSKRGTEEVIGYGLPYELGV